MSINTARTPRQRPVVGFTWSPVSIPLVYNAGGNIYPPTHQEDNVTRTTDANYQAYITPTNTPVTFTAQVIVPAGVFIVEYAWNFGDGTKGYGPSVAHTYTVASGLTSVSLTVTDSFDTRVSMSRVLNLRYANVVIVGQGIRVGS